MSRIKRLLEVSQFFSALGEVALQKIGSQILPIYLKFKFIFLLGVYCTILADPAQATTTIISRFDLVCDAAAQHAAEKTGVPSDVLMAITRTETGLEKGGVMQPWPWTVNMEGRGVWFDTKSEALEYVFDHFKTGARSFDIGCFQINYRWHGAHFASIEEMFDPSSNAIYAALFLKELYTESGDWTVAAGGFHSRTPARADRYMVRFEAMLAELDTRGQDELPAHPSAITDLQRNRFPLLQKGQASGLASLVPLAKVQAITPVIDLTLDEGS
jgi:hypothetical protein